MKKIIMVTRGPKSTTTFLLNGNKKIKLKLLYKGLTNPETYKGICGDVAVETRSGSSNPFLTIANKINVNKTGMLTLRSTVTSDDGEKQKINIEHQLDVTNTVVTGSDIKHVLQAFTAKINVPSYA